MPRYRIFPPIGIARLGGARIGDEADFFLAPEAPGAGPQELLPDGSLAPVQRFKDANRTHMRKQGARFHLFESEDGAAWSPAQLPPGATVTWTVHLANKKAAVQRPADPPTAPMRPVVPAGNETLVIDGGVHSISGSDQASAPIVGRYETATAAGAPFVVDVELGQLKTDRSGRLIVLGSRGDSGAPAGTPLGGSFYRNPKWFDDVADGPVAAEIKLGPGEAPILAEGGAWVVVAPPDYAPEIACPVTLFDVMRQVGIDHHGVPVPIATNFDEDIEPLISRVRRLRWVHEDANWSDPRLSSPKLRSRAAQDLVFRQQVRDQLILKVEEVFEGHIDAAGPPFEVRAWQKVHLANWVSGNFDDTPVAAPGVTAQGLTRAALDGAAGQGFCPGIEAGILILDHTIYLAPFDFRFDHSQLRAGDMTALMAQPWQADFFKCNTEWWPTQRPDVAFQTDVDFEDWIRGAAGHRLLVDNSGRLGVVVRQGADEVFLEVERDPTL
jgi:L-Lysine epsilon oxidase N-terminal/L-lysine epsilon oxidase C-terminal domain